MVLDMESGNYIFSFNYTWGNSSTQTNTNYICYVINTYTVLIYLFMAYKL